MKGHVVGLGLLESCTSGARGDDNYYLRKGIIKCCHFEHTIGVLKSVD